MEQFGLALVLFASFWVGALAGWLAMKIRERSAFERGRSDAAGEIASLTERIAARDAQAGELKQQIDAAQAENGRQLGELRAESDRRAAAEARCELIPKFEQELAARAEKMAGISQELAHAQALLAETQARTGEATKFTDEKIAVLSDLQTQLAESFRALSADALRSNNQSFLDLASVALEKFQEGAKGDLAIRQQAIDELVKPLREQMERVDSRMVEMEKERAGAVGAVMQGVEALVKAQQGLQSETRNLVFALRSPAARGRWGEVQLRRVVEMSGMVEYCDFEQQPVLAGEEGTLRPDMVIQLPNQRRIVVDAKVALSAYLEALECTDEQERAARLRAHADQVRSHLNRLSAKQYWEQFPQSPEFVIAFVPGETFFSAALEQDPSLVEFGVERRVILATPTTLIALLKAIAYGWKQESLSANAREIQHLGRTLYERVRGMAGHWADLQKNLERANQSFNRATGAMESRVLPSARRLKELGAGVGEDVAPLQDVESTPRSLRHLSEAADDESQPIEPSIR